ncbi:MAG: hypothetical protein KGI70_01920 [Patescibacteria group bacterium]|nr:hypothetical protein [Patescibacteria group bacterium]
MSAKWIWAAVAVVVIVAGLWWAGVFNRASNQGAAVVLINSAAQADPTLSNSALKGAVASIDVQLAAVSKNVTALGSAPTKVQISAAASSVASASTAMTALSNKLRSRSVNAKTAGTAVPPAQIFSDLANQISNANSAASTAQKNTATSSPTTATLSASASQLKTAQSDLVAARADIQSIFQTLGIN